MKTHVYDHERGRHIKDYSDQSQDKVVICSGDHYWRENSSGYTNAQMAGVYTRDEAYKACGHCGPEKYTSFHDVPEDHIPTMKAKLAEAEEVIRKAQEILFCYTDNEITSDPWWCVVRNGSFGRMIVLEGPFFSRERARQLLEARRYEYGAKAYVYCFSGCRSEHYKDLRKLLKPLDKRV